MHAHDIKLSRNPEAVVQKHYSHTQDAQLPEQERLNSEVVEKPIVKVSVVEDGTSIYQKQQDAQQSASPEESVQNRIRIRDSIQKSQQKKQSLINLYES